MNRLLPTDPRLRAIVIYALAILGLAVAVEVAMPAISGSGMPTARLFLGLVDGMVGALTAVGIVVVYRTLRVINFAQTAIGLVGSVFMYALVQFTNIPFVLAFPLGLAVSAGFGAVVGVVLLRFFNASRLVLTVVTIIGAGFIIGLANRVYTLPFFPKLTELTNEQKTGAASLRPSLPFSGWEFQVGGQRPGFGFSEAFAIEFAIILLIVVAAFFRYTRVGVAVRAMAENPERASLLGIGVGALSIIVWAIAGLLSGASTGLTGMLVNPAVSEGFAPILLLSAFAAAVAGGMESVWRTVFASVLIGVLTEAWRWSFPQDEALIPVVLFLALSAVLLLQRRGTSRVDQGAAVAWSAVEEQRAIPKILAVLPPVRISRYTIYAIGLFALGIVPFVASALLISTFSVLYLSAIVTLSVIVLTGWGGQVSLGQWGFAAIGAVVGGSLTSTLGFPFWIAVPIAAAVTGAFSALVGLPALRIRGLFLLPVTFAFAVAVQSVLFNERYFGWLLPNEPPSRPTFFFLDFRDDKSMYFLCAASLVLALIVVGNLRRSRTGRILIAMRENDANAQSFGVPVVRTKLLAFAIAGSLSGFAGAIFVHQQQGLNVASFGAQRSVQAFAEAIFGGVGSSLGALLGAAWFAFITYFGVTGLIAVIVSAGGPLFLILAFPGGLISIINAMRDSVLRVIAQRRQLVVPSLFADFDAEALENRQIPLAEADSGSGLAALPASERFELPSELYRGRRAGATAGTDSRERAVIGGAASGLAAEGI